MDLDLMWGAFVKYREMLDEMYAEWSKMKAEREQPLAQRKTIDGRAIREDELHPTQVQSPVNAGQFVSGTAHPQTSRRTVNRGDHDELEALQDLAAERGVEYDRRWKVQRLRDELGLTEDEEFQAPPEQPIMPGDDDELDRLREIADERGVKYNHRWRTAKMRAELGFDEDEPLPPSGSDHTGQGQPPSSGAGPMEGVSASGAGAQANPVDRPDPGAEAIAERQRQSEETAADKSQRGSLKKK